MLPTEKISVNTEPLFLFDSLNSTKCKRDKHDIIQKNYYTKQFGTDDTLVLPAHFCNTCGRHMMGHISYSLFIEHFGKISAKIDSSGSSHLEKWNHRPESKLHSLGYNVQEGKLSINQRQSMLIWLLKSKQISFFDMVATIESDINQFQYIPRFNAAVAKWKMDLQFISNFVKDNPLN